MHANFPPNGQENSLHGITWDHSRGFVPLVATGQWFHELHSEVDIAWIKRSLQEFADKPLVNSVEQSDLLVINHPWLDSQADKGSCSTSQGYFEVNSLAIKQSILWASHMKAIRMMAVSGRARLTLLHRFLPTAAIFWPATMVALERLKELASVVRSTVHGRQLRTGGSIYNRGRPHGALVYLTPEKFRDTAECANVERRTLPKFARLRRRRAYLAARLNPERSYLPGLNRGATHTDTECKTV